MYQEPILRETSVKYIKQICDAFGQNSHVFVMSVELLEEYIRIKKSKNQQILDPLLATVTIIFICHKSEGALESLKIKHVIDLLFHLSKKLYNSNEITAMEGDIIVQMDGNIPIKTPLDDMDIVIDKYMSDNRFKVNVRPLCLKLLEHVYMEKFKWFYSLKEMYSESKECILVFKSLTISKYYIPVSVFIAAVELTHYRYVLDIENILDEITKQTNIHQDHIRIMVAKIKEKLNFL